MPAGTGDQQLVVYLDIDGTILYDLDEDDEQDYSEYLDGQFVCEGLETFLGFACEHCDVYWLSYRARLGKRENLERHVLPHLPEIARSIDIAHWNHYKFEGLTTERPFIWFDDYPEPEDLAWLRKNGLEESLIIVDQYQRDKPRRMLSVLEQRIAAMTNP